VKLQGALIGLALGPAPLTCDERTRELYAAGLDPEIVILPNVAKAFAAGMAASRLAVAAAKKSVGCVPIIINPLQC
jgi:hypothetical protein